MQRDSLCRKATARALHKSRIAELSDSGETVENNTRDRIVTREEMELLMTEFKARGILKPGRSLPKAPGASNNPQAPTHENPDLSSSEILNDLLGANAKLEVTATIDTFTYSYPARLSASASDQSPRLRLGTPLIIDQGLVGSDGCPRSIRIASRVDEVKVISGVDPDTVLRVRDISITGLCFTARLNTRLPRIGESLFWKMRFPQKEFQEFQGTVIRKSFDHFEERLLIAMQFDYLPRRLRKVLSRYIFKKHRQQRQTSPHGN